MPGRASRLARTTWGSRPSPSAGAQPSRRWPWGRSRRLAASRRTLLRSWFRRSTSGVRISASRVATSRPLTRSNSLKPSCASACASSLLAAGCEICSAAAASVSEPVRRIASKISIWRRRMAATEAADKAHSIAIMAGKAGRPAPRHPTETTMHIRQWTAALCAALLCGPAAGQVAVPAHENLNPEAASGYQAKQAVSARHFMVATANPLATQAGYRILKAGGSAADAAIAAQLVLGLTEPQSSGIGGGGFMVHYAAGPRQVRVYDSRETAPAAARPDRFMRDGKPLPFRQAVDSGLSVGTPGLLRGLELAHRQQGRLPWRTLFQPAIELATQGFGVAPRLHAGLVDAREALAAQPAAARYFLAPDGQPWPVGHVLK